MRVIIEGQAASDPVSRGDKGFSTDVFVPGEDGARAAVVQLSSKEPIVGFANGGPRRALVCEMFSGVTNGRGWTMYNFVRFADAANGASPKS